MKHMPGLADEPARQALETDGFAVLRGFTTPEDVGRVRALVEPFLDGRDSRLVEAPRDLGSGDAGASPIVEVANLARIEPRLTETLFFRHALAFTRRLYGAGARCSFDHAIDKSAFNEQPTQWHQDNAYSRRVTLSSRRLHWWLPLQPVDEANGCMWFVPGSHRGPRLRHAANGGHALRTELPEGAQAVACPLALGDVTVHLPTTLHATGPNHSDRRRLAWVAQMSLRAWPPRLW